VRLLKLRSPSHSGYSGGSVASSRSGSPADSPGRTTPPTASPTCPLAFACTTCTGSRTRPSNASISDAPKAGASTPTAQSPTPAI
jgi:hypothetical protein